MARFKSAWVAQSKRQIEKVGRENASWLVVWKEPDGRQRSESCGPGPKGKRNAERRRDQLKAQLLTGTYQSASKEISWEDFRFELRDKVYRHQQTTTCRAMMDTLRMFGEIIKPRKVSVISTHHIADFTAKRRTHRGRKPGSVISAVTVNKDLRHLRTALTTAVDWGYLETVPKFRFLKEPKKLPRYVTPEHFSLIYSAADTARLPLEIPFAIGHWWRGLLVMAQMTGWRIGELLSLRWDDVDLEAQTAITRHRDNKVSRDEKVPLHPLVIEHLLPLRSFKENVFPWPHDRRTLYSEFYRLQESAGIHLPCPDAADPDHGECTRACFLYSFHDERRAFATLNAPHMTREALQALMRHRSPDTTARYINMAQQLNPAVARLHVPAVAAK